MQTHTRYKNKLKINQLIYIYRKLIKLKPKKKN